MGEAPWPCLLFLLLCAAAPILSNGVASTGAEEAAGRQTVLDFRQAVRAAADPKTAAVHYLANDFHNHDLGQPSGAQAYVDFLGRAGAAPTSDAAPTFVLTDGDLTMLAYADAGGRFTSNLYEVRRGRILQIWSSGPATAAAPAGDAPPVADGTAPHATREADKALVERFIQDFFVRGDDAAASALAPDIVSHVAGVPSGHDFAKVARKHQDRVVAPDAAPELFALADGELVAIGFAIPYASDLGAWYAQSIVRVKNNRIVEWWYSGYPAGHPKAT